MNIINKICEMHPNDYNVISDDWLEPVHLEFGQTIPSDFQTRIERELDRLDVEVGPFEDFLSLKLDIDADGIYHLTKSGELLYRFANHVPGFFFPNYDVSQAIAWTIYAIVSRKEKVWFCSANNSLSRGAYVSCRGFSARQQAVAACMMKSVSAQSVAEIPADMVSAVLTQMMAYVEQFTQSVPIFSHRPILEPVFSRYKEFRSKSVEINLGELAKDLYGNESFENEITSHREFIRQTLDYGSQVAKARKELTRTIYNLPIMVVSRFFMELNEAIAYVNKISPNQIEDLMDQWIRFSMTADKLKSAFEEVDSLWMKYAQNAIRQDFLRQVLEETKQYLDDEQLAARKICKQMRRELSRFCFVDTDTFKENESVQLLGWKQLMELEERDLSASADLCWSGETLIQLQRKLMNPEQPNCWLCAPSLKEQSVKLQMTDQFDTQAVPLMDHRCVFALWVRDY